MEKTTNAPQQRLDTQLMIMRIHWTDDDHRKSVQGKGRACLVVEDPEAERGKDGRETWECEKGTGQSSVSR